MGAVRSVSFDVSCPVCGGDMELVARGKPYRTEVGMEIRCSAPSCRCDFSLRVHLMPNGARSTNRLSGAIRREGL